jgi:hypothetical protein
MLLFFVCVAICLQSSKAGSVSGSISISVFCNNGSSGESVDKGTIKADTTINGPFMGL